jgi:hypothetical protein
MRLLRLPLDLARLPLELGLGIARRAASVVGLGGDEPAAPGVRVPPQPRFFRDEPPPAPATAGNGGAPAAAPTAPPEPPEPAHVSEEPELVAEVAEQGAEDGAGAEVRIDEPWPGYDGMRATEIRARLEGEPAAVAAAVSLYETSRKGRSTVLDAASRRLSAPPSG